MSDARKLHNDPSRSLDLQINEIINTLTGKAGKTIAATDPTTGIRYSLTMSIVGGVPTPVWSEIE